MASYATVVVSFVVLLALIVPPSTAQQCTVSGRIPDPTIAGCTGYVLCSRNAAGTGFVQYKYACAAGARFDPARQQCSTAYACPAVAPPAPAACTTVGTFPDADATNCRGYVRCARNADGTFARYAYTCASGAQFDPAAARCSTTYVCPA